jgi:hypothetical protein
MSGLKNFSAATILIVGLAGRPVAVAAPGAGLQNDIVFSDMTPLSRNSELARRLLPPVQAAQMQRALARSGKAMGEQPLTLSSEHFADYVPPGQPADGYGLLV